jgi:hypothetical protein
MMYCSTDGAAVAGASVVGTVLQPTSSSKPAAIASQET